MADHDTERHPGQTGSRATPGRPVVAGHVKLRSEGAGMFPPHMEDPFPVKNALVRLYSRATPPGEVWTRTDRRGYFAFDAAAVGGRPLTSLELEVYARTEGQVGACYESAFNRWSFVVANAASSSSDVVVDVVARIGPRMEIEVPNDATRFVRYMQLGHDGHGDTLSENRSNFSVYRAFYAFCFVTQMRSWLWGQMGEPHAFHLGGEVNVVYPANMSWSAPGSLLYIDSGNCTDEEYRNSWLAHEFGHHLFLANARHAARVGGSHGWYAESFERSPNPTQMQFRSQIARDFSEGFATFVGQSFLQDYQYQDAGGGTTNIESGSARCAFGDYATSAYFWDLADDHSDGGEAAALGFTGVMRAFKGFADARGHRYLVVPDFHDYLISSGTLTEAVANAVLEQNDLRQVHTDWQGMTAAVRQGAPVAGPTG